MPLIPKASEICPVHSVQYLWRRAGPAARTIQNRLFFMPPHQDAGASPQAAQPVGAGGGSQVIAGPRAGGARFAASSVCVRGRAACIGLHWVVGSAAMLAQVAACRCARRHRGPERVPACYRGSPVDGVACAASTGRARAWWSVPRPFNQSGAPHTCSCTEPCSYSYLRDRCSAASGLGPDP